MEPYFNEFEPYAAAWLRNLWPEATVDDRSIVAVQPGDLAGHRRVHLFAGIGGWEYALTLADWPEDREVWTGSCPCQPFSGAGRNDGVLDERHLWPAFHRLIAECLPATIFGEQVASAAGRAWLAGVRTDLEDLGYAVGAADLCAASIRAPHIRQRLYWVAESAERGRGTWLGHDDAARNELHAKGRGETGALGLADATDGGRESLSRQRGIRRAEAGNVAVPKPCALRASGRLADPEQDGRQGRLDQIAGEGTVAGRLRPADAGRLGDTTSGGRKEQRDAPHEGRSGHAERPGGSGSLAGGMGDAALRRGGPLDGQSQPSDGSESSNRGSGVPRGMAEPDGGDAVDREEQGGREHRQQPANGRAGFWDAYDLLPCRDGKARRVEPGSFPLAHGVSARMGRLRAYGNAIVPEAAAEFVRAYMDAQAVK